MEHAEAPWKGVAEAMAVEHTFQDFFELEAATPQTRTDAGR